ncbi:MAG: methylene-tetrahydromethanopterin dehydrogenase N-terminal domain-containing protein [Pseudomonadota bacterium]
MKKNLLFMLTPGENISPFDITLAADSGFEQIHSMTGLTTRDVKAKVQDAIFSRPPGNCRNTGIFIGGHNVHIAKDMFQVSCDAMVSPFEASVFVDPNGAYTTAASIVALVEHHFLAKTGKHLNGVNTAVFGVGPVGLATAVLFAEQGANTRLCKLTASDEKGMALRFGERYGQKISWIHAETLHEKLDALQDVEIVICAARAGVRILDINEIGAARNLCLAADTNAVPPAGIGEIGAKDDGKELTAGNVEFQSIGPMTIGNVKYKVQSDMFKLMTECDDVALLDFPQVFQHAKSVVTQQYS